MVDFKRAPGTDTADPSNDPVGSIETLGSSIDISILSDDADPLSILMLVGGLAAMGAGLLAIRHFARRRATMGCPWEVDARRRSRVGMTGWVCADCGASGYTNDGQPPKECGKA